MKVNMNLLKSLKNIYYKIINRILILISATAKNQKNDGSAEQFSISNETSNNFNAVA